MKRTSVENGMVRLEGSGRKSGVGKEPTRKEPTPRLALSIPEFCEAHGISEGMFYKMKKQNQGLTPREMKIGTRTLITFEAAAKWRAEREAASTAPPEKAAPRASRPFNVNG
jgi:predicted DNA-binding transcriptional regulator AlpA